MPKVSVMAKNKVEAKAIQVAMNDPAVHAFVVVIGILNELPTDRARARVLRYVEEMMNDPDRLPPFISETQFSENRLALADEPAPNGGE